MSIDWDKPIVTTDGYPARVISRDYYRDGEICFVVQVQSPTNHIYNGDSYLKVVDPKTGVGMGVRFRNKTRKVTKWYNLYAHQPGFVYMDHEETARSSILHGKPPLKTLSIEIEEPCD